MHMSNIQGLFLFERYLMIHIPLEQCLPNFFCHAPPKSFWNFNVALIFNEKIISQNQSHQIFIILNKVMTSFGLTGPSLGL